MIDIARVSSAVDATWPAQEQVALGPLTLRRSAGGGKRVTAATSAGVVNATDVDAAEARMREWGQSPLFSLRPGDDALDDLLAARGYAVADPTHMYAAPINLLADLDHDREQASLAVWEPLAIQIEMWAAGGIGADRLAVMDRAAAPKTALIGRHDNSPGGTCFVSVDGDVAMVHALEVLEQARRVGMGRSMTIQAAKWSRDEGARHFSVLCTKANVAANALYRKLGMTEVGQYHYRIKESV